MSQDSPPHPRLLGLLRQAKLCPDQDGPRLVLADWLEESGHSDRAEFVRLQLWLAPGAALDAGERAELESRCQGLVTVPANLHLRVAAAAFPPGAGGR
jgi:uncharacterized protein (TIGR02996 family)